MKAIIVSSVLLVLGGVPSFGVEAGSFDKTLSVSGPVELDVVTDSGQITIRQGSSGSVRIHASLKASHGWFSSGDVQERMQKLVQNPPIEQNGGRVRIGYVREHELLKDISIRFEIETPAETQVHARADSGGIRVEGVKGPVDCKADSGGIEVRDIAAPVHAVADSGGIQIRNVKGQLFARVDSGGIDASGIQGSIDAQTDSGSIRLGQTTPASVHARADSGGVHITLTPGAGYDVNVETESGRISVPEMVAKTSSSRNHVAGKIGSGGPLVKVNVESGGVEID